MPITNMPFGPAGTLESVQITRSYGELNIWHGLERYDYFLETEIGISTQNQICGSAGIALTYPGAGGSGNLTTVTLTETEVPNTIKKVPVSPGTNIDDVGGRLLKAYESCFLLLGYDSMVSLEGRGTAVWDGDDQGTQPGSITFSSAYGTFSIASHADSFIKQLQESQSVRDVHTWSGELSCFVENSSPTSHPLSLDADVTALIPANTIYVISHTQTMTGDLSGHPTDAYTVTCHPTT